MNNTNNIKYAVNRLIAILFIVVFVLAGMVSCGKTAEKEKSRLWNLQTLRITE